MGALSSVSASIFYISMFLSDNMDGNKHGRNVLEWPSTVFMVFFSYWNWFVCLFMALNATFNNISAILWWSVLLVEETGENHQSVASHWQTLWLEIKHVARPIMLSERMTFKILLPRNHLCVTIIAWSECSSYNPLKRFFFLISCTEASLVVWGKVVWLVGVILLLCALL